MPEQVKVTRDTKPFQEVDELVDEEVNVPECVRLLGEVSGVAVAYLVVEDDRACEGKGVRGEGRRGRLER